MKNKKIMIIMPAVIGLLMLISIYTWAKPCTSLVTTASGSEIPMGCHYFIVVTIVMSVILISLTLEGVMKKEMAVLPVLVIGVLLIAITTIQLGGLHACAGTVCNGTECATTGGMPCQSTVFWLRIFGIITVLLGIVGLYNPEKQV